MNMNKFILATGVATTMVLGGSAISSHAAEARGAEIEVQVTTSNLNLRTGPSTSYKVITKLQKGTKLSLVSSQNGWSKVVYNNKTIGFVSNQYITNVTSNSGQDVKSNTITGLSVNFRSQAGTSARVLGTFKQGDKIVPTTSNPVERNGLEWREVKVISAQSSNLNGRIGWVAVKFTNIAPKFNNQVSVGTNKVTNSYVNARTGAGTHYSSKGKLYANDTITPIKGEVKKVAGLTWVKVTVNTSANSTLVGQQLWVAAKYTNITVSSQTTGVKQHSDENCGSYNNADTVHTGKSGYDVYVTTKDVVVYKYNCEHKSAGASSVIPAGTVLKGFMRSTSNGQLVAYATGSNKDVQWYMNLSDFDKYTKQIATDMDGIF